MPNDHTPNASAQQNDGEPTEQQIIEQLEIWQKEGALRRDTGTGNQVAPGTLESYMQGLGWVRRDLQLCLARAKPSYRRSQLAFGTITEEGIKGGYPFESHCPLIGDVV